MIHLVPKNGARVRDPISKKILGADGVKIPAMSTFWFRRLQDEEVMEAPQEKVAANLKKEKKEI